MERKRGGIEMLNRNRLKKEKKNRKKNKVEKGEQIPVREALRLLFAGFLGGAFLGGFVFKWTPVGQAKQAYIMTEEQLFFTVLVLIAFGFGVATISQYPMLRLKKLLLKGRGHPVAIEYIRASGEISLDVVNYERIIHYDNKTFALVEPSFSILGLKGYRIHENCNRSLDFDTEALEEIKEDLAKQIEENTKTKNEKGETYSLIPAAITIRALSPVELRHVYRMVYQFALSAAQTKAEKTIKMTFLVSVGALIAALSAAYFAYGYQGVLESMAKKLGEVIALIKASGGLQQ